jgi:hypothetical protein
MKKFGMLLVAAVLLISCGGIESEAKKQLRESLKHEAVVPESVKISDEEVVFKNDSLCVIFCTIRQTKSDGPVREDMDYRYAKTSEGVFERLTRRGDETFEESIKDDITFIEIMYKHKPTIEEMIVINCKNGRKVK